jgi:hypothetical protein
MGYASELLHFSGGNEAVNRPEHTVEIKLTETLKAAADLGNEVNRLRTAMREIAFEVSAVGCEGADDAICIETERAKEDWCPYCRIGMIVRDAGSPVSATDREESDHG